MTKTRGNWVGLGEGQRPSSKPLPQSSVLAGLLHDDYIITAIHLIGVNFIHAVRTTEANFCTQRLHLTTRRGKIAYSRHSDHIYTVAAVARRSLWYEHTRAR